MIVLFNPAAGWRRIDRLWRVLDVLGENGIRFELVQTGGPGHATTLARDAARAGAGLVVAAGGDGTVAEVATGLLASRTPLGIIPLGTANVLARELRLPTHPRGVAAMLAFRRTRPIWPGIATLPSGSRLFVQMLGAGFDAEVVKRLPPGLKRLIGRGAYALQTLGEVARYPFVPLSVRIDGRDLQAASVVVSKGRFYGGPFVLAPGADPGAQGFSVALFDRRGPLAALGYAAALPLNLLPGSPGLTLLRGRVVEIHADREVPAQTDGDLAGNIPALIQDAEAPIEVVVCR